MPSEWVISREVYCRGGITYRGKRESDRWGELEKTHILNTLGQCTDHLMKKEGTTNGMRAKRRLDVLVNECDMYEWSHPRPDLPNTISAEIPNIQSTSFTIFSIRRTSAHIHHDAPEEMDGGRARGLSTFKDRVLP